MKTYTLHSDPAHGWLAVKRAELVKLGILEKISHYSYQRGLSVYLEEDLDMGIFLKAKKAIGQAVAIKDSMTDKRSPIRSYESFSSEPVNHVDVVFNQLVKDCPVRIAIKSTPVKNYPNRLRLDVVIKNQKGDTLVEDYAFRYSTPDDAKAYALSKADAWIQGLAV